MVAHQAVRVSALRRGKAGVLQRQLVAIIVTIAKLRKVDRVDMVFRHQTGDQAGIVIGGGNIFRG